MIRPQISGLDQFRDHLVGKRNDFAHLLWSALYVDRHGKPCNLCAKGDKLRGGRPKGHANVRELARQHTEKALKALVDVVNDAGNAMARVRAADILLCRGWGAPEQVFENKTSLADVIETAKRRIAANTPGTVVPFPATATAHEEEDTDANAT